MLTLVMVKLCSVSLKAKLRRRGEVNIWTLYCMDVNGQPRTGATLPKEENLGAGRGQRQSGRDGQHVPMRLPNCPPPCAPPVNKIAWTAQPVPTELLRPCLQLFIYNLVFALFLAAAVDWLQSTAFCFCLLINLYVLYTDGSKWLVLRTFVTRC